MKSRKFRGTILGKTKEDRGFFLKRTVYLIAIRFDEESKPPIHSFEASFEEYCVAEIGGKVDIELFRTDAGFWVSSEQHAEHLNALAKMV